MTILKIYSLDDENENTIISVLSEGEHIIGRDKLNCKDKRVSRNHALLIISEDKVLLKSTHINPSFYKPIGGNSIKLVKKDESVIISDGDQFALLADVFWFKTRVIETELQLESSKNIKRVHEEGELEDNTKKARVNDQDTSPDINVIKESELKCTSVSDDEDNVNKKKESMSDSEESLDFTNSVLNDNLPKEDEGKKLITNALKDPEPSNQNELVSNKEPEEDENELVSNKEPEDENELVSNKEDENELVSNKEPEDENDSKELIKTDGSTTNVIDPSTSTKSKRPSCWYGAKCYRRNPLHKEAYSHPGDSDYEEIPDCPFGGTCYRTNTLHRKQYKHTNLPAAKPTLTPNTGNNTDQDSEDESDSNTPQGKRKRKAAAKVKKYAETPEDDYDLEDPFINDASSDDFKLTDDDDSDTDWKDSQEVEEETQERKRLLKEAKKFTKKK